MKRLKQGIAIFLGMCYIIITKGKERTPNLKGQPKSKKRRKVFTMTKREFLTAVANANISDELTQYASEEISKLDAVNAKRRESDKPTKASMEAAGRREQALLWVKSNEGKHDAAAISEGTGLTVAQVPAALKNAISGGLVEKSTVKVDSKHRKTVYEYVGE